MGDRMKKNLQHRCHGYRPSPQDPVLGNWVLRVLLAVGSWGTLPCLAQGPGDSSSTGRPEVRYVLDDQPFPSARGDAQSGALITTADDLDAAYHNPAGIGGLEWGKQKMPWVRKFYFPWAAVSANTRSIELARDFNSAGGNNDSLIGKSVLAAHAGRRQFARAHILSGIVLGRFLVTPINDYQIAATVRNDRPETLEINEAELIDGHFRSISGLGGGMSAQSPDGTLSLGIFSYRVDRTDVEGSFTYDEMADTLQRRRAIQEHRTKRSGSGQNVGLIWQVGKQWSPTLGITVRDLGGTTFSGRSPNIPPVKVAQNTSVGLTLGPEFKFAGGCKLTLQGDRLEDPEVALTKKYRIGAEIFWDGHGSYATFALRAGASHAGPSMGMALNLGLVGLNAAVHRVDIGVGNQKVFETRSSGDVYVNVAEF